MELKGKKIAFLGDSITEGVGTSGPEHLYWQQIADVTGAQCYGYGISGTRIAPQHVPSEEQSHDLYFRSRVHTMIPDADIVVVFGGTNDCGHGDAPIGTVTDRTEDTFCGAFHLLLTQLLARYPAARLVVMTPLHRLEEETVGCQKWDGCPAAPLISYVENIRKIAEYYGIPVADMYRDCTIQPVVPTLMERYMPDGLHPNDAGHQRIVSCLLPVLQAL